MKKLRKLSLKEELEKEAAEIERELAEDPELDNLEVSKELDDAIYAEIQRYEKEQEEELEHVEIPKAEAIGTSLGDLFKNIKL